MWTFDTVFQFVSCLAVIGMLVVGFGATRRVMPGTSLAPSLLGVLFGVIAVIQMFQPLEIAEGVIVDGRTIPVALAGAFLGLRGLILCMAIAVAARIGIGGIGWSAGVMSILIAGMAGAAWARMTADRSYRGLLDLVLLGAMMSTHVVGVLLLPIDIAMVFLKKVVPVIVAMNMVAVPVIGALLEREYRAMQEEARQRARMLASSEWGIMPLSEFQRTLGQLIATGSMGSRVGLVTIRLSGGIRAVLWGRQVRAHLVAELTRHVHDALPNAALVGDIGPGHLVVALPDSVGIDEVIATLRDKVTDILVEVPGTADTRLPVKLEQVSFDHLPSSEEISKIVNPRGWLGQSDIWGGPVWSGRMEGEFDEPAASPRLFRIAEDLISQNVTEQRYRRSR